MNKKTMTATDRLEYIGKEYLKTLDIEDNFIREYNRSVMLRMLNNIYGELLESYEKIYCLQLIKDIYSNL